MPLLFRFPLNLSAYLGLGFICIVGCTPRNPEVWRLNPEYEDRLADYADVGGYEIRPPKGYTPSQRDVKDSELEARGVAWTTPPRPSGTAPLLMVVVSQHPGAELTTAQERVFKYLRNMGKSKVGWSQTRVETGTINGIKFAHARWSGIHNQPNSPLDGKQLEGFVYFTKTETGFIQISSQDVESESLTLAEAAAMTFRRK